MRKARERRDHGANILVGAEISGILGFLRHGPEARGVDQISGFIHRIESNPSWVIPEAQYIDIRHSLSIVLRRGQIFAIHCDSSTRAVLARWLKREPRPPLRQVSQNIVQGAFLRGEAKGLWLHGTHVRSAIRPDAKHITGMRVQDALSPMEDSSFAMAAVRARIPDNTGLTAQWPCVNDFCGTVMVRGA